MTKCDKCGEEVGNLFCAKCRSEIEKKTAKVKFGKLIPLLFYDQEKKQYIFGCTVKGCPCNQWNDQLNIGLCATRHIFLPNRIMHEFDGDNIAQQVCG